jgi:hypothetical protein
LEDKPEFYETLAKMAPTKEEELKLKHYSGDLSKIDPAERFLKSVLDVPFAFKRVDAMLYRANFDTEVNYLRKSFGTLEVNCYDVSIFSFDFLQYFLLYKLAGLYMFPRQPFIILSNKFTTIRASMLHERVNIQVYGAYYVSYIAKFILVNFHFFLYVYNLFHFLHEFH